jgi:AcrR family transcriptional regulator
VPTALGDRAPARKSFRETQFEVRQEAILDATHRLLAQHGYDTMSMDDIAADVGIAKGSLYRHFASKDDLVAAVMVRLLRRTRDALAESAGQTERARLEALLRWTLRERLGGGVPHLPATSQALRDSLLSNRAYLDELLALSDELGELIQSAKRHGQLNPDLDDAFVLYTFYARACDPTLDFLRAGGEISDDRIVEQMTTACFCGIGWTPPPHPKDAP